jgi:hypothetical protein
MKQIADLTNNAFSTEKAEAFTFSSGIFDFNNFILAVGKHLPINAVYSIDPSSSLFAANPSGGRIRQYASGAVGGFLPGFEPMPFERWVNEEMYESIPPAIRSNPRNDIIREYLHNNVMPKYTLQLALKSL